MTRESKANDVSSINVGSKEIIVTGKILRTARIKEEWYADLEDPASFIGEINRADRKPDIFTFWQRLPEVEPRYEYYYEWDSLAVLRIKNYDSWWEKTVEPTARNKIRKANKKGTKVRLASFDDEFVRGMTKIFDETPVRQGKPFWHYGKGFETVKREFSRNLHREDIIGAYFNDELIGYIMLAYADRYAIITQILSMIEHRDKAPNNALMAEAVRICDKKNIPYLVYAMWVSGTLGEFKRSNGFEKIDLPRYYIPLTMKGKIATRLHLHHGYKGILPEMISKSLIDLRRWRYTKRRD
jgi:hypothetical protein